ALLGEQGLSRPCRDDIAHAVAGMRKRPDQAPPAFETFGAAGGRVSGQRKPPRLACLAPPKVRTTARFLHVHRLFPGAHRGRKLWPPGGAKSGSTFAKLRTGLDQWPACKALMKRFRADAAGLLACQKVLKRKGLSHDPRAPGESLIDTMPSCAWRQELRASLAFECETATTLGRDRRGLPLSSDAIESLFAGAKHHRVCASQEAARTGPRLPAL